MQSNTPGGASAPPYLEDHTIPALLAERELAEAHIKELKATIDAVDAEYLRRFGDEIKKSYAAQQKESGTQTFTLPDGAKVKGDISKTVKWDGAVLMTLASSMTWEQVKHYFKIDFSVAEAVYNALEPGALKDALTKARTVKYGDLKVKVEAPKS